MALPLGEVRAANAKLIAEVYSRAVAAGISTNDPGVLPEAEGKKAVVGFIRMMKALGDSYWATYDEEKI